VQFRTLLSEGIAHIDGAVVELLILSRLDFLDDAEIEPKRAFRFLRSRLGNAHVPGACRAFSRDRLHYSLKLPLYLARVARQILVIFASDVVPAVGEVHAKGIQRIEAVFGVRVNR
jgi:hypothetical protein